MRGVNGRVEWGYYDAATMPTWEMVGSAEGGTVTGTASQLDTVRVSQSPLVFSVPARGWRWPIVSLQIHGQTIIAIVGPCEE